MELVLPSGEMWDCNTWICAVLVFMSHMLYSTPVCWSFFLIYVSKRTTHSCAWQNIFFVPYFLLARRIYQPRGRVWGGSSSLNAMVYVRGHAYDYDRWEKEGAHGWSYADCLPYFRKSQTHELGELVCCSLNDNGEWSNPWYFLL